MIEKISTTFDFGKLLRNLDRVFDKNMDARKRMFSENAKEIIKGGRFKKLRPGTQYIRRHGLSPKRGKTSSTKPLIHTGNLLASIKPNEEGVQFASYGKHHLEDYVIVDNKFTDYMEKAHSMFMVGTTVPARNFLPITAKGNLTGKIKKRFKKVEEDFYKAINRFLTK